MSIDNRKYRRISCTFLLKIFVSNCGSGVSARTSGYHAVNLHILEYSWEAEEDYNHHEPPKTTNTLVLHYFHMYLPSCNFTITHLSLAIYHIFTAKSCRRQETPVM